MMTQENNETIKATIQENIQSFYRDMSNDKIRYERCKERYSQIKSGEYVVTQEEHNKAISIIKEAYPEYETDELATKQLEKILRIHFSEMSLGLRGIYRRRYFLKIIDDIKNISRTGKYSCFVDIYGYNHRTYFYEYYKGLGLTETVCFNKL
jgi:hypothetical protein